MENVVEVRKINFGGETFAIYENDEHEKNLAKYDAYIEKENKIKNTKSFFLLNKLYYLYKNRKLWILKQ